MTRPQRLRRCLRRRGLLPGHRATVFNATRFDGWTRAIKRRMEASWAIESFACGHKRIQALLMRVGRTRLTGAAMGLFPYGEAQFIAERKDLAGIR